MAVQASVTATCWRDGRFWVVSAPGTHRSALTEDWSEVEAVARTLVSTASEPVEHVAVPVGSRHSGNDSTDLDLVVSDRITEALEAAAASREDADRMSVEAIAARRERARRLAAEGVSVRHIASLLGVSYGRAQHLVGHGGHGNSRPPTARPHQDRSPSTPAVRMPRRARRSEPTVATVHNLSGSDVSHKPHDGYRHEAFLYGTDEEFVGGLLPFVLDGLARHQPVMVAVAEPRLSMLRSALGVAAHQVRFVDMGELGRNPAHIIPGWRQFVAEHSRLGRPVRGIGEPIWAERTPEDLSECQLHEALLNIAIDPDVPLWLRCPYNVSDLPAEVVKEAMHSHPTLVEGETYRGSRHYAGLLHVEDLFAADLPRPDADLIKHASFSGGGLRSVRALVKEAGRQAGLTRSRTNDLLAAVTEVSVNSVQHGGGGGLLSVWNDERSLVVEISDAGHITDALVGRRRPSELARRGRGLWLANQLSDLVRIRSSANGTTIRMHVHRVASAA